MKWSGSPSTHPRPRHWLFLFRNIDELRVIWVLRIVWIIAILWYEVGVFHWSVVGCRWPDKQLKGVHGGDLGKPTHVLLIADPQVLDEHSYPERGWLLTKLSQYVVDLNMRKSWSASKTFNPDAVVFLGDMMDNGRFASSDEEYRTYYERFKSIFSIRPSTPVFYIPGNHDVGLGNSKSFSPLSRTRYKILFGPTNHHVSIANHTFVFLDAPGLVEEDYRRAASGKSFKDWHAPADGAIEYLRILASQTREVGTKRDPAILFTHIPLFRPDTATCGPLRERGTIRRGVGFGYQNTLGRQTSEFILRGLRPRAVFSGDDHDYCEYAHVLSLYTDVEADAGYGVDYAREVTVKSFSMAMGVRRPGFQLLSLLPAPDGGAGRRERETTYADAPCFLPDQLGIYTHRYIPLLVISLFVLAISNYWEFGSRSASGSGSGSRAGLGRGRPANLTLPTSSRNESGSWTLANPFDKLRSRSPSPISLSGARTPRAPSTPYVNGLGNGHGNGVVPSFFGDTTNRDGYAVPMIPPAYRASPIPSPAGLLTASSPAIIQAFDREEDEDEDEDNFREGEQEGQRQRFGTVAPRAGYAYPFPARRLGVADDEGDLEEGAGARGDEYFFLTSGRHRRRPRRGFFSIVHGRWSWTWTFVFRGRRRRVSVGVPSALQNVFSSSTNGSSGRVRRSSFGGRKSPPRAFVEDVLAVATPPLALFTVICIIMFW